MDNLDAEARGGGRGKYKCFIHHLCALCVCVCVGIVETEEDNYRTKFSVKIDLKEEERGTREDIGFCLLSVCVTFTILVFLFFVFALFASAEYHLQCLRREEKQQTKESFFST
jgi:hypothetical protein